MLTIKSLRGLYGATQQDTDGKYFSKELGQPRKYGCTTNAGTVYVCFTCGDRNEIEQVSNA